MYDETQVTSLLEVPALAFRTQLHRYRLSQLLLVMQQTLQVLCLVISRRQKVEEKKMGEVVNAGYS
jgi:hypothetical protein